MTTEVVGNCGWTYAPVSEHSRAVIEGRLRTFAYDGPVEWTSFADHLVVPLAGAATRRTSPGSSATTRSATRPASSAPQATEEELERMEGYVAEAMHAGALGLSTGLEFKPGREAPTEEIVRLNKVVGRYGGHYTSHMRNRDSSLQDSTEEFLRIIREGGTRGEISHFNVRNRTGAAPGAWQRAVDTMQAAREVEGLDVLADTTPFRDGLGADGRDPAAVGAGRRLGGGLQAPARPRRARAAAARVRPLLALHPPGRVGSRPPPGEPAVPGPRGQGLPRDLGAAREERVGVLLRHPGRRRARRSRASC